MDFTLTDEQQLLRDTAVALFAKECPAALVRAHIADPSAADPLTTRLREFVALAEGSLADLCLFLEPHGAAAAPGPFFPTVALFAPLLMAIEHELVPRVLDGELSGTVALAGADGEWRPNAEPVKTFVPEADRVDLVAVVDAGPSGPSVRVAAGGDARVRSVHTEDFSRRLFEVDASAAGGHTFPIAAGALDAVLERATVALAADMVGTARHLFDMTLEYAKERYQFGVPIGSFQAIQHKLADMSLEVERARGAVQYAAMTIDADDAERHRAVHVAKAAAGRAAVRAAKDGIQIHGGIGFTWEHDLHLFLRRAFGSEHWMGSTDWHHDRLADLLI
ncbi:MAG TPA: acyl-CoA dehydrogenase [Acidimicrobiia bacterium]|nr:acyl-CoA dehydrogenase [Acidimicrobiia bacterium]